MSLYNMKSGVATLSDLSDITATADEVNTLALANKIQVAAANGAIAIQDSVVVITKGTAAAMTLGTPTAAQNGTVITIVSATAAAHTVTAATIGFNAGNAASDVGTFGGAIGDGFSVVAYGGEWYTLTNTNVTLG